MKTDKLFYADTHLVEFSAVVVDCFEGKNGFEIELDQTAFYPEGGGQAADKGLLEGIEVLHVHEEGERVLHRMAQPLPIGETVEGKIDYAHRFDLMQQHTGEHIVSGIINAEYGYHNVGFHMGWDSITIDFDGVIPPEKLPEIEALANEAIYRNIPLKIWTPSPEELPGVSYRTKRELPWPVRIVNVPGCDSCACCGLHVERTGEIGLIKLFSCVRFRSGSRIEMLCGKRCLDFLSRSHEQNRLVSAAFSAKLMETGDAARSWWKARNAASRSWKPRASAPSPCAAPIWGMCSCSGRAWTASASASWPTWPRKAAAAPLPCSPKIPMAPLPIA